MGRPPLAVHLELTPVNQIGFHQLLPFIGGFGIAVGAAEADDDSLAVC